MRIREDGYEGGMGVPVYLRNTTSFLSVLPLTPPSLQPVTSNDCEGFFSEKLNIMQDESGGGGTYAQRQK